MKVFLFLILSTAFLLTGCSTVDGRIREKASYFNSLDAQTQERLKRGGIHVGDTTDMVYIAFGQPDRVRERTTGSAHDTTWVYNTYYEEYEGTTFVGFERRGYYGRDRLWHPYYRPVHADVYSDHIDEFLRVVFRDGKVIAIEQENRR